jgi:transcriptional regulator with AAA-type ATPase domain
MISKEEFLNPLSPYYGQGSLGQIMFNANLQEFANKVDLLCALQTGGKISADDAYAEIKQLWKALKASKKTLIDSEIDS